MINTLEYAKKLEAAGVSREQAEAHVQIISKVVEVDMATKQDLKELEFKLTIKLSAIMTTLLSMAVAAIKLI